MMREVLVNRLVCYALSCCGLLLGGLAAVGCGGQDGNGTLIGFSCADSSECGPAGVCVTDGKDGLCTLPCEASGKAEQCPGGSYCDDENVAVDGADKTDATLCFPACDTNADCRDGYKCGGITSGPGKVCHPK